MSKRIPAEVFPPGEFVRDEIESRGWSQAELAEVLGLSSRLVDEVVQGRFAITPEIAYRLGVAFGTGTQFWMSLESV